MEGIQGLRTKHNGKFDASKLFKELNQIKPANAHWTFTSPAAMIGIALAIFMIIITLSGKRCTNKDKTPTPTLSAHPMPAQNLNLRPLTNLVNSNQATKSNVPIPINIHISIS
jgi:hypothetical protein